MDKVCSTPLSALFRAASKTGGSGDQTTIQNTAITSESEIVNMETRKQVVKKIHRYIQQHKLSEHEVDYIHRLFEMDITRFSKQSAENESGVLLVVNENSDATFNSVINFLNECEQNWNKKKEDSMFPKVKRKSEGKSKEADSKKVVKKVKIVANPLIKEDEEVPNDPIVINGGALPGGALSGTQNAGNTSKGKHPLEKKLRMIDNKKHPLAFYKGPYNRIMRTVRNISAISGIPDYTKKNTSELLGSGFDEDSVSIISKPIASKIDKISESEELDEDNDEADIEELEEELDNEDGDNEDLDLLIKKYVNDDDVDDGDVDDVDDDVDVDEEEDEDEDEEPVDNEDAAGDDDDDDEDSVEYSE